MNHKSISTAIKRALTFMLAFAMVATSLYVAPAANAEELNEDEIILDESSEEMIEEEIIGEGEAEEADRIDPANKTEQSLYHKDEYHISEKFEISLDWTKNTSSTMASSLYTKLKAADDDSSKTELQKNDLQFGVYENDGLENTFTSKLAALKDSASEADNDAVTNHATAESFTEYVVVVDEVGGTKIDWTKQTAMDDLNEALTGLKIEDEVKAAVHIDAREYKYGNFVSSTEAENTIVTVKIAGTAGALDASTASSKAAIEIKKIDDILEGATDGIYDKVIVKEILGVKAYAVPGAGEKKGTWSAIAADLTKDATGAETGNRNYINIKSVKIGDDTFTGAAMKTALNQLKPGAEATVGFDVYNGSKKDTTISSGTFKIKIKADANNTVEIAQAPTNGTAENPIEITKGTATAADVLNKIASYTRAAAANTEGLGAGGKGVKVKVNGDTLETYPENPNEDNGDHAAYVLKIAEVDGKKATGGGATELKALSAKDGTYDVLVAATKRTYTTDSWSDAEADEESTTVYLTVKVKVKSGITNLITAKITDSTAKVTAKLHASEQYENIMNAVAKALTVERYTGTGTTTTTMVTDAASDADNPTNQLITDAETAGTKTGAIISMTNIKLNDGEKTAAVGKSGFAAFLAGGGTAITLKKDDVLTVSYSIKPQDGTSAVTDNSNALNFTGEIDVTLIAADCISTDEHDIEIDVTGLTKPLTTVTQTDADAAKAAVEAAIAGKVVVTDVIKEGEDESTTYTRKTVEASKVVAKSQITAGGDYYVVELDDATNNIAGAEAPCSLRNGKFTVVHYPEVTVTGGVVDLGAAATDPKTATGTSTALVYDIMPANGKIASVALANKKIYVGEDGNLAEVYGNIAEQLLATDYLTVYAWVGGEKVKIDNSAIVTADKVVDLTENATDDMIYYVWSSTNVPASPTTAPTSGNLDITINSKIIKKGEKTVGNLDNGTSTPNKATVSDGLVVRAGYALKVPKTTITVPTGLTEAEMKEEVGAYVAKYSGEKLVWDSETDSYVSEAQYEDSADYGVDAPTSSLSENAIYFKLETKVGGGLSATKAAGETEATYKTAGKGSATVEAAAYIGVKDSDPTTTTLVTAPTFTDPITINVIADDELSSVVVDKKPFNIEKNDKDAMIAVIAEKIKDSITINIMSNGKETAVTESIYTDADWEAFKKEGTPAEGTYYVWKVADFTGSKSTADGTTLSYTVEVTKWVYPETGAATSKTLKSAANKNYVTVNPVNGTLTFDGRYNNKVIDIPLTSGESMYDTLVSYIYDKNIGMYYNGDLIGTSIDGEYSDEIELSEDTITVLYKINSAAGKSKKEDIEKELAKKAYDTTAIPVEVWFKAVIDDGKGKEKVLSEIKTSACATAPTIKVSRADKYQVTMIAYRDAAFTDEKDRIAGPVLAGKVIGAGSLVGTKLDPAEVNVLTWYDADTMKPWNIETDPVNKPLTLKGVIAKAATSTLASGDVYASSGINNKVYDGKVYKPAIKLTVNGTAETKGYSVVYYDADKSGKRTGTVAKKSVKDVGCYVAAIVIGKGKTKTEVLDIPFEIEKKDISTPVTPLADKIIAYKSGTKSVAAIKSLKIDGVKLTLGADKDYTYSCGTQRVVKNEKLNFSAVGVNTVIVNASNSKNFKGATSFKVVLVDDKKNLAKAKVTVANKTVTYSRNGWNYTSFTVVTKDGITWTGDGSGELYRYENGEKITAEGVAVTYFVKGGSNSGGTLDVPGKVTIKIAGLDATDEYYGVKTATYNIKGGKKLAKNMLVDDGILNLKTINKDKTIVYNGNEWTLEDLILRNYADTTKKTPYTDAQIVDSINNSVDGPVYGVDFKVSYEKNIKPGKASIIIEALPTSEYIGTVKQTFTIQKADISSKSEYIPADKKAGVEEKEGRIFYDKSIVSKADLTLTDSSWEALGKSKMQIKADVLNKLVSDRYLVDIMGTDNKGVNNDTVKRYKATNLKLGTDFKVSYSGNTVKGSKAVTVKITGINGYTGTYSFTVDRPEAAAPSK